MLSFIYRNLKGHTLGTQLKIWVTVLIWIPVIFIMVIFTYYEVCETKKQKIAELEQAISMQHNTIERWFSDQKHHISYVSRLHSVRTLNYQIMQSDLQGFMQNNSDLSYIAFINSHGRDVNLSDGTLGTDVSDQDYFKKAIEGSSHVTYVLPGTLSGQPMIVVSYPVYDLEEKFIGVVAGFVRLSTLDGIMAQFRLGQTGESYLINRDGYMLTEPGFLSEFDQSREFGESSRLQMKIDTEGYRNAIRGISGAATYLDYRGKKVIGAYHWMGIHNWIIIGEVQENEILQPVYKGLEGLFLGFLLILAGSWFLTIHMTKYIKSPIDRLSQSTRLMQEGNYQAKIETGQIAGSPQELQDLCKTFNQMAATIEFNVNMLDDYLQLLDEQNKALTEAEQKYRTLVEGSPLGVVIIQDDEFVYTNPRVAAMFGYTHGEFSARKAFTDHVFPEDRPHVLESQRKKVEGEGTYTSYQIRGLTKDGAILYIEIYSTPCMYEGKVSVIATLLDVTEKQKAKSDLQISEARYRAIVEDQTELICRYLPGGTLTYVNEAYCRYFNKHREELVGTSFIPHIPEEDHVLILQQIAAITQDNPVVTIEHRVILPDGQVRWQQWTDRAVFSTNGQIAEYQAAGRDITERVNAQLALQQAHDELDLRVKQRTAELQKSYSALEKEIQERNKAEEVLRRYQLLMEQAHDIILIVDTDSFQIIDANEAAVSSYGYSREELLARKTNQLLGPGATCLAKEQLQQLMEKGLLFESVHQRQDGSCFPVDVSIFGCILRGQRVVMSIIRDITERKQAEKEMLDARERITRTERLASLGTMAAGIAHEINQPLNSIKVTADSLLYWHKKGKEHKLEDIIDDIEGVSVQAGRIDKIIKHMRAMVHGQNIAYQCISLNYAVEGALDLIQSQLERHRIKITKLLEPELPPVHGDLTQLEGVVVNLAVNAMQSLDAIDRADKEIILKTYADEHVILEIIDNGTGIDDETREKIFTPFFTTKPVGEGMGMGLCIVHSVIASYSGEIHVSKNDFGGATFQIKIPKA